MKLKIEIKNRFTGKIIFEFETENNTMAKTIAKYVEISRANLSRANLSDANLSDANLSRADLSRADLSRADLSDADLSDANLSDADLDNIKYDFFGRMLMLRQEIPALREKVIAGEINGSSYTGTCACFVGTIANIKHENYEQLNLKPNSNSATERWFMGIKEGMKPETHNICAITLGWIDEFLALIK